MNRIIKYLKETRGELRHVSWPTKKQVINFTLIVIGISVFTAIFLGFFDIVFTWALETFIL